MDRRDFLTSIGIGATALACASCLEACSPVNGPGIPAPPSNVNLSLDLAAAANSALKSAGGYIYNGGLIIAHLTNGSYAALSQTCTHQGGTVQYLASSNVFFCPVHGSAFSTDGAVLNGPAGQALKKYNTALSGTTLKVTS